MLANEFKKARLQRLAAQKRIEAAEEKIQATFLEREFGKRPDNAAASPRSETSSAQPKPPPKK